MKILTCMLTFMLAFMLAASAYAQVQTNQDFQTDIPGMAYTPFTTPAGVFQIETDIGNFSQTNYGNYSQRVFQTFDPVLKYGLSNSVDVEASFGGYENVWTRTGSTTVRLSGFGDITPRLRWTFLTSASGALNVGVIAAVKIPTASTGIGNGQVEYHLILPIQYDIDGFQIQSSPEIDVLNNSTGTGKQFNYFDDISLSHSIFTDDLSVFVELAGQHATDSHTKDVYTADTGVGYQFTPTSIVTFSVYAGLNSYSPQFQTILSIAKRF